MRVFKVGTCVDCNEKKEIHAKGRCCNCKAKYWRNNNKEKAKNIAKKSRDKAREDVLGYYGGECACCKETIQEFLAMDHINNDGYKHRKNVKSNSFYIWIRKNKYPKDLQILCHNCNLAKGFYGKCPHEK